MVLARESSRIMLISREQQRRPIRKCERREARVIVSFLSSLHAAASVRCFVVNFLGNVLRSLYLVHVHLAEFSTVDLQKLRPSQVVHVVFMIFISCRKIRE